MRLLKILLLGFCATAWPQALKPGDPAPLLTGTPINSAPAFKGWDQHKGNYVILDFWATWCGPCTVALPKIAALSRQFQSKGVDFITIAMDEPARAQDFLTRNRIELPTYTDGPTSATSQAFGVYGIPVTAVIDPHGRILAVTSGENINAEYVQNLLKGGSAALPALEQPVNLDWDKTEIAWQDGVRPLYEAIIKPIQVRGAGIQHEPGSNRISGDGLPLEAMIQYCWQTDSFHTELKIERPTQLYRAVVVVPQKQERFLFSSFQAALENTFGFTTRWVEEEKDVLVLRSSKALPPSTTEALFEFLRGQITMDKQTAAKLAEVLPNWTRLPVLNETGLQGTYDFDLDYRDDRPDVLISEMKTKYGLILEPARRKIKILVVEPTT